MNNVRKLRNWLTRLRYRFDAIDRVSHAQCGEDLLIQYVFNSLGIRKIAYLDIGAHHPSYLSNTYYFYLKGHRGVCVEPDPALMQRFTSERPGDRLLNIGIGREEATADFYVMSRPTLNTFSKAEAERFASYGKQSIERVLPVRIRNINTVIAEEFGDAPNLISLDVEGMDLDILQSIDFERFAPDVLCVETLTYTEDQSERKITKIIEFMQSRGYFVYADTYVNSIFVRSAAWRERGKRGAA